MTFWLVVAAAMLLMTGHPWLAAWAIYFAFASISYDEPDKPDQPPQSSEIPKKANDIDDIDKTG